MKSLLISLALIAVSSNAPAPCPLDQPVIVNPAQCFDAPGQLPRFAPMSEMPKIGMNVELVG
jgi:hypothetical protein